MVCSRVLLFTSLAALTPMCWCYPLLVLVTNDATELSRPGSGRLARDCNARAQIIHSRIIIILLRVHRGPEGAGRKWRNESAHVLRLPLVVGHLHLIGIHFSFPLTHERRVRILPRISFGQVTVTSYQYIIYFMTSGPTHPPGSLRSASTAFRSRTHFLVLSRINATSTLRVGFFVPPPPLPGAASH